MSTVHRSCHESRVQRSSSRRAQRRRSDGRLPVRLTVSKCDPTLRAVGRGVARLHVAVERSAITATKEVYAAASHVRIEKLTLVEAKWSRERRFVANGEFYAAATVAGDDVLGRVDGVRVLGTNAVAAVVLKGVELDGVVRRSSIDEWVGVRNSSEIDAVVRAEGDAVACSACCPNERNRVELLRESK